MTFSAVWALSWWFRARPRLPDGSDGFQAELGRGSEGGGVVGTALLARVDDDNVPDLVACFWSSGESLVKKTGERVRTGQQSWIAAVSGRTGLQLWQHPLAGSSAERFLSSELALELFTLCCHGPTRVAMRSARGTTAGKLRSSDRACAGRRELRQFATPVVRAVVGLGQCLPSSLAHHRSGAIPRPFSRAGHQMTRKEIFGFKADASTSRPLMDRAFFLINAVPSGPVNVSPFPN